jgi:hypothetical protein
MSKISILKDIYLENRFIYNKLEAILFEEMRNDYCGKSWYIRQVSFEYLMFTNFVALTFWLKTWTVFLFNEALSFINYRLIWEKILKCKGEQIDLKTETEIT